MVSGRLRVLLVVLGLLVLGFAADRLHLVGSSKSHAGALSAADYRAAQGQLARVTAPTSFRPKPCPVNPAVCFESKRPLHPMSSAGALAVIRSLGLPLRDVASLPCDGGPPVYKRGHHLMGQLIGCTVMASLDRFVVVFAVTAMNSDCRALKPGVGTHLQVSIGRVGKVDAAAIRKSPAVRDMQTLNAKAAAIARSVAPRTNHAWPRLCRSSS